MGNVKSLFFVLALANLLLSSPVVAGAQFYKCNVNGTTQYQQTPCPSNEASKSPTVEELNSKRQKQLTQDRNNSTAQKLPASSLVAPEAVERERESPPSTQRPSFKCDGRKYCSQMTSCAEAKYFLSSCPGVKMDGDRDGIPCEEQWCNH